MSQIELLPTAAVLYPPAVEQPMREVAPLTKAETAAFEGVVGALEALDEAAPEVVAAAEAAPFQKNAGSGDKGWNKKP